MCYLSRLVWLFSEVQKCLADISPKTEDQNLNVAKLMIYILYVKYFEDKIYFSDFKIKSSENNIFVILFKIDFKYTKRRGILMRI